MKKITLFLASAIFCLTASAQDLSCEDGVFLDVGGVDAGYEADEMTTTVISGANGEAVTITFTYVDIEASANNDGEQGGCWDFMTIYDGPDTDSPILAMTLCGEESGDGDSPFVATSLLSVGDSFTSTDPSGALTIVFTSDATVQETGWSADITCETLSISENDKLGVSMFPNPVINELNIVSATSIDNVKVFNLLGQVVIDQKVNGLSGTLEVSTLKSGAYLVQITGEGQTGTYKLLKQ